MTNNITITDGTTTVTIYTSKVDNDIQNTMIEIAIPRGPQTKAEGPLYRIGNLQRIKDVFIINGLLGTGNDTTSSVTARDDLRTLATLGNHLTMTYGVDKNGTAFTKTGFIKKLKITEESQDPANSNDPPRYYDVILTLVVGDKMF